MANPKYDLEDRPVDYTCRLIDIVETLPDSGTGNYIANQLVKSCHSPTFNYGEVQAAETRADFIHKLGVCLKELKECRVALKIVIRKELIKPVNRPEGIFKETEALIGMIAKSIGTARKNRSAHKNEN